MTTNSYQNMNVEEKYAVIIPLIGHPSIIFKMLLTKNLKSINKKYCTIFKAFKVQIYFSLKNETPLALQQMPFTYLKVLVITTKPILIKQKDIWQLWLRSIS